MTTGATLFSGGELVGVGMRNAGITHLYGGGALPRGLILGRVVKMTPRALARFQSIPDDYKLPATDGLAITIIGNAVPPLMYQKLISQLVEATE